jgi:CheY-like chemotaxis protein/HPt (histidine-containing phosphotransfer) domain-containing protein
MMGGQIWVESPVDLPGKPASSGSMFHFTASFGIAQTPAAGAYAAEQSALVALPVLVVDDNSTNRRILEVQLTNWKMKPTAVEGGASALNALELTEAAGTPFKLALLDFHMPGMDGLVLTDEIRKLPAGNDLKIIMMSSSVHQNQTRQRLLGIDASLLKPVKAAELLSVIKAVLSTDDRLQTKPRRAALKTETPLRVLVAEDSPVNQKLIQRLLEKWGHTPVIARDGRETLARLDAGGFDLVLMDLQMPEINGLEATAAIRQKESGDGTHIPIIALTAHALKGDRERCIEAGMDDYLSKPIEAQKLFAAIEAAAHKGERATGNDQPHIRAVDIDALLKSFDGDRDLVSMLAKVFADSSPGQLSELDDAVTRGDAEALASGAHALRGSVANFRAEAAVDAATRLEQLARSGDLSAADSALAVLQDEIEQLREELETFEQVSLS